MDNNSTNRITISVICPHCGAQQEAENGQDAVICRYCGKPFSVRKGIDSYRERYNALPGPDGEPVPVFPRVNDPYYTEPKKPKKRHTFWWVMGWIFCFPIPLTILILRNRKLPAAARIAILVLGWIAYLALGLRGRAGLAVRTPAAPSIPAVTETASTPRPSTRPTATPKPTAAPEPAEDEDPAPEEGPAEEPEPEEAPVEEPAEEPVEEEPSAPAGVTPEFKEAMDSYEAFFDEYCDFMQTMAEDPTNVTVMLQYADFMSQYAETMEKLDAIDEAELSPADDAYYIEVMARIDAKLLEAANYMN